MGRDEKVDTRYRLRPFDQSPAGENLISEANRRPNRHYQSIHGQVDQFLNETTGVLALPVPILPEKISERPEENPRDNFGRHMVNLIDERAE
jgi:hypothetical protein